MSAKFFMALRGLSGFLIFRPLITLASPPSFCPCGWGLGVSALGAEKVFSLVGGGDPSSVAAGIFIVLVVRD